MIKKVSFLSLLACFVMLFSNTEVKAQDYDLAVGARFTYGLGISAKKTVGNYGNKIEGILYLGGWNTLHITGLYEVTNRIGNSNAFTWYYGGGLTLFQGFSNDIGSNIGVDGVVGIEWNPPRLPLNLSLDVKPTVLNFGTEGVGAFRGINSSSAFTLRYIIR